MTAETNGHASPHTFHTSPTYLPHISHTSPTHLPRIFHASPTHLPRISHVQAGLQPACFLLRVCNPRHPGFAPLALKGLRRRNAAPPKVAALFHFPGSQTRPQKASGCKPAATGESTWKFAWGQCGSLSGKFKREVCIEVPIYITTVCLSRSRDRRGEHNNPRLPMVATGGDYMFIGVATRGDITVRVSKCRGW